MIGGLLVLSSVVLAVLKIAGVIAWSWLAVSVPFLVLLGWNLVVLVVYAVALIGAFIVTRKRRPRSRR